MAVVVDDALVAAVGIIATPVAVVAALVVIGNTVLNPLIRMAQDQLEFSQAKEDQAAAAQSGVTSQDKSEETEINFFSGTVKTKVDSSTPDATRAVKNQENARSQGSFESVETFNQKNRGDAMADAKAVGKKQAVAAAVRAQQKVTKLDKELKKRGVTLGQADLIALVVADEKGIKPLSETLDAVDAKISQGATPQAAVDAELGERARDKAKEEAIKEAVNRAEFGEFLGGVMSYAEKHPIQAAFGGVALGVASVFGVVKLAKAIF